jgi:hypothetical protein
MIYKVQLWGVPYSPGFTLAGEEHFGRAAKRRVQPAHRATGCTADIFRQSISLRFAAILSFTRDPEHGIASACFRLERMFAAAELVFHVCSTSPSISARRRGPNSQLDVALSTIPADETGFVQVRSCQIASGHGPIKSRAQISMSTQKSVRSGQIKQNVRTRVGTPRAATLSADLVGESPIEANYPVGLVVISASGGGDESVWGPEVNVQVRWAPLSSPSMEIGQAACPDPRTFPRLRPSRVANDSCG